MALIAILDGNRLPQPAASFGLGAVIQVLIWVNGLSYANDSLSICAEGECGIEMWRGGQVRPICCRRARQLSRQTALQIIRSRWHIENTAFHQWIRYWNLGHVFRHGQNVLLAILLLWMLAFNLLQLFIYRRLGRCRRPKDPTDTIRHIVEVMLREVATLPEPIPWAALLLNTS